MRAALIALVLVATALPARAAPRDELEEARAAYRVGQYEKALPLFNGLVYPPPPRLASQDDQVDTYIALGVCRYKTGDTDGAKREFEAALTIDPNSRIDPQIVADDTAVKMFNETKLEIRKRAEAAEKARRRAELIALRDSYVGIEQHQFFLNFVPFGLGQFQNRDNAKGIFFATTEGLTLGTSVVIWSYLLNTYGVRSTHVPLADGPNVRFLQQIEIGSGLLFFGLAVLGAVDAYRHYTPQTRAEIDESLLPAQLRGLGPTKKAKTPAKPKKSSLLEHVSPIVTPNGGGIGLSWEND